MQCNRCGSTIKDGLKFCTKCGAELDLTQTTEIVDIEKRYCTNCGKLVENGSFCTNCGAKINDGVGVEAKENNKKRSRFQYKKIIILIVCCVLVLGIGGFLGINHFMNGASDSLETAAAIETTGNIVVDVSDITEKVTDEESAFAVLNSVSEIFGFENAKDVLDIQKTDYVNGDTYYRFAQKYREIPVYGKSIVLSADEHGNVFNISGNYMAIDDTLNTEPKLKAEKAKKKIESQVKKELKKGLTVSEPELVVLFINDNVELVWRSDVVGYTKEGKINGYKIFLSSDKGDIVSKEKTIKNESIEQSYYGKNIRVDLTNNTFLMSDEQRNISGNDAINKRYWLFWEQYEDHKGVEWSLGEQPDEVAVDAHYNIERTYDYYSSVLNHSGCDGSGAETLESVINVEYFGEYDYTDNAFYTNQNNTNYIVFGQPNELASRIDVVAHEYTHGVNKHITDFRYSSQSGALDEAYADIMGELVEGSYNNQNIDWMHGNNRNLINPNQSENPSHMSEYLTESQITNGNDEVHYNSTIISHAAYLMWDGMNESGAIKDVDTLANLWYSSLYMLNEDSDFAHCRTAVEISAERLFAKNLLTEEQVKCVSAAFDEVGIGKAMLYDTVPANSELCVYAANNSEYYNYHYKVEKISIKNLYSVGKAVETDIKVVEEDDVTEEKVINLTSLSQDSSHKCAYRITISDLSDEPGEEQTKFVVVSDAQDAKRVLSFYTDYVPPVGDLLEKINVALDNVKSVHLSQNTTSDYTVMGSKVNMGISLESDVNLTNGIMHTNMTTKYGGRNIANEIYIRTSGNTSDIYMSTSGMWVKQTGISASDLYKLGSGFEGVDGIKFYLNSMENVYLESDSDEQNHIISGVIGSKATEEALKKAGLSTIIDQLDDNDEISKSDIQSMLSNLAPMKVTFLISKDTFLPTQMTIDMKDTTESIYSNMKSIAAKYGESISYSISTNKAVTDFSKYNGLSEIFIPDEAVNGTDYKIIK